MDSRSTTTSVFPGFDRLYKLSDPVSNRAFRADIDVPGRTDVFALLRGEMRCLAPIEGRWAMGGAKPSDVVWTTYAVPVLLSQRVIDLLRKEEVTGWDVIPCDLRGKKGESWPYGFLQVHGRCGAIDEGKSMKIDKIFPGGVFPAWIGLYFEPASWDGSDVFMPEGRGGWVIVTERVKAVLEKAKVRNVLYTALDRYELVRLRNPPRQ